MGFWVASIVGYPGKLPLVYSHFRYLRVLVPSLALSRLLDGYTISLQSHSNARGSALVPGSPLQSYLNWQHADMWNKPTNQSARKS